MDDYNREPVENAGGAAGTLRVRVLEGGYARPAQGVTVEITDPETGSLVAREETDENGLTPAIELGAPPEGYSLEYGSPRPFDQYDLRAVREGGGIGGEGVYVENVQIYPGEEARQEIDLTRGGGEVIVPYPALWGEYPPKIPESEIKPIPAGDGSAVLPEPVVPGLVTVHAGRPGDANAPDYTVDFRDYVKNVASSEIYSTWPVEALRANVIAITSFTLNRVYTEWYRSRGYDFTITSSTAYDQSFSYGRTIYRSISDVVDELFTTYVARGSARQPLFAQYCDGRRVSRDGWLSQWGSCELARQGFTAQQILRRYYGSDIELREARRVEGIPLSFPGVLREGSRGDAVRTVQSQLNVIARSYPAIGRLAEDGVYGPLTAEAVRRFQRIFGPEPTGVVNFPTWYKISAIYTSVAGLAE